MRVLAVDVGGSHVSCGAVEDRQLLKVVSVSMDSNGSLAGVLRAVAETLHQLQRENGRKFDGVAFGFCGLVDHAAGRIISTNRKYEDATEFDLPAWAAAEFNLPLILENDSRMALLGECHAGAAQDSKDVVLMTLGTGIGTAVMMEGRLIRGKHFQAGCLGGHFTVAPGGRLCSCGARGCFEAEASTYALREVCRNWPDFETSKLAREPVLDFRSLFQHADGGDPVSVAIRTRCLDIWKACALSLVHAYDPELLVLGGGVSRNSFPVAPAIEEHLRSCAWTPWGNVRVRLAKLGSNAALLGAVTLFREQS